MLAGSGVGDHFALSLYNKVILTLNIFQAVYMYSPKNVESDF